MMPVKVNSFIIFICLCTGVDPGKVKADSWSYLDVEPILHSIIRIKDRQEYHVVSPESTSTTEWYTKEILETSQDTLEPITNDISTSVTSTTSGFLTSSITSAITVQTTITNITSPTTKSPNVPSYPPSDPLPGDWSDSYFIWNLSFVLDGPDLYNNTAENRQEILTTLRFCFWDPVNIQLGYKDIEEQSISITDFEQNLTAYVHTWHVTQYSNNQTLVKYSVLYSAQVVLEGNTTYAVGIFINDTAMNKLKNATLSGLYGTDDGYIENYVATVEIPSQTAAVFNSTNEPFCDTVNRPDCPNGYNCVNNVSFPCVPICYQGEPDPSVVCCNSDPNNANTEVCEGNHETCVATIDPAADYFDYYCSCIDGYAEIFGTCLDSFWVAFTALAVAIVTIVICGVLVVIICTQKPKKRRKNSTEAKYNSAFTDNRYDYKLDRSKPNELTSIQTEKSATVDDGSEQSIGNYPSRNNGGYGSDGPASSSSPDVISENEIPIELLQSPAYTGFQANLAVVDTSVNYFSNRPAINIKRGYY